MISLVDRLFLIDQHLDLAAEDETDIPLDIAARIWYFGIVKKCEKCANDCKMGNVPKGTKLRFTCSDFRRKETGK